MIEPAELQRAVWPDEAPTKVVRCRHCRTRNRVPVDRAIVDPASCTCGTCDGALFLRPDEPLEGLRSTSYEHGLDRKSLDALRAVPGFSTVLRKLLAFTAERPTRMYFRSAFVECGPEQFPELHELLQLARTRLGTEISPTLFIGQSPHANAGTLGYEDPVLLVNSGLVEVLADDELLAVMGHELGHLCSDHSLYRQMARLLTTGAVAFGGLGALVTWPLQKALAKWSRCAELTADRAGLLASRDLGASLGALLALAGGPRGKKRSSLRLAPFVRQARELAETEQANVIDGAFALLMTLDASHPFVAWRVMHLIEWVEHGSYLDLLAGDYERLDAVSAG